MIDDSLYINAKYKIYTNGVYMKDDKGKRIGINDLKIGDSIYVVTKDGFQNDIGQVPPELYNVKFIKLLKDNSKYNY